MLYCEEDSLILDDIIIIINVIMTIIIIITVFLRSRNEETNDLTIISDSKIK